MSLHFDAGRATPFCENDRLIQPEVLLAEQIAVSPPTSPMGRLAAAMLHQAFRDLRHASEQCELRDKRRNTWWRPVLEDTLAWIDGADAKLTFETCCDLLGWNHEWLGKQIHAWVDAGCPGKIRRWMRQGTGEVNNAA